VPPDDGGEVSEALARMIQDYLAEDFSFGPPTPEEWLGQEIGLTFSGGKIVLPKPVAAKLAKFAAWVASKYATKPGMNVVYGDSSVYVLLADGSKFFLCTGECVGSDGRKYFVNAGTPITKTSSFTFSTGYSFALSRSDSSTRIILCCYDPDGNLI